MLFQLYGGLELITRDNALQVYDFNEDEVQSELLSVVYTSDYHKSKQGYGRPRNHQPVNNISQLRGPQDLNRMLSVCGVLIGLKKDVQRPQEYAGKFANKMLS